MKPSPLWKLAALLSLLLAYLGLYRFTPPRHRVESHWGENGVNWFGQSQGLPLLWAVTLLALLYLLRYAITRWARSPESVLTWYALLLASLLPGVWLLVVTDWDNEAVAEIGCWAGTPIALLFVPTAVLVWDVAFKVRLSGAAYAARALVEVIVFVPIWSVAWAYFEMFVLGWFGV
jgi:hypothetical protein